MKSIDLMINEHKNIKRILAVMRKICLKILNGHEVDYHIFHGIIDFVRNYADKHHHGKEESMLFNRMLEESGPTAEKLIRYGMNVEHDLGRFHISELEASLQRLSEGDGDARLDVIVHAMSYANLLNRHIDKEDGVVYKFAEKNLSPEIQRKIDYESQVFEEAAQSQGIQEKYLKMLEELE